MFDASKDWKYNKNNEKKITNYAYNWLNQHLIHETKTASIFRLIETLENMAGLREERIKGRTKSKVNPQIALNSAHD